MDKPTVVETIEEMGQGNLLNQLSSVMKRVASAILTREKSKGQVTLTLNFERKGDSSIHILHKLAFKLPTQTGTLSEDSTDTTAFIAGVDGTLYVSTKDRDQAEAAALTQKRTLTGVA